MKSIGNIFPIYDTYQYQSFYITQKATSMQTLFRGIVLLITLTCTFLQTTFAQQQKGTYINASIGLGITTPNENVDVYGNGIYIQGEYVWAPKKWFSLRPYVGYINTSTDEDGLSENLIGARASTNAFFAGGKTKLSIPIPWVAPYIEIGLGASVGSFETVTPTINEKENGVTLHIPFSFGLALGRHNNVDVGLAYYFYPMLEQFNGAFAVGISFPLNR
ncbi:outer membrane beta-barrel protein [uncultured Aquimarina sp.]|uniref:outer membrane beta-barrel protein n=1 Tax=uncultured Aquimarina sp. TaxID=575652 RepID=UPI00261418BB|nr:outer membrane beta-barrel protein [uncultured Aquimarina sp.]